MRVPLFLTVLFVSTPVLAAEVEVIRESAQNVYKKGGTEVRMLVEKSAGAYLGKLTFAPGTKIPAHRHPKSDELLTILSGEGLMTIGGKSVRVKAGDAVRIPMGTEHDFEAGDDEVTAVQVYTPTGPEARFREWNKQK